MEAAEPNPLNSDLVVVAGAAVDAAGVAAPNSDVLPEVAAALEAGVPKDSAVVGLAAGAVLPNKVVPVVAGFARFPKSDGVLEAAGAADVVAAPPNRLGFVVAAPVPAQRKKIHNQ